MTRRAKSRVQLEDLPQPAGERSPEQADAAQGGFTLPTNEVGLAGELPPLRVLSPAYDTEGVGGGRQLKASGDLAERLRGAATLLRRDLAGPHFERSQRRNGDPDD